MPVFSLVLDRDVPAKIALTYPELYKELTKGRSLSYKTFFLWVAISIYQGKRVSVQQVEDLVVSGRGGYEADSGLLSQSSGPDLTTYPLP